MRLRTAAVLVALAPSVALADPLLEQDAPVRAHAPTHRYAYAGAGAFLLGGVGMSLLAKQQATRADSLTGAREYAREIATARASAASAGALYALAGATLVYALVLEFLPETSAERAGLALHF